MQQCSQGVVVYLVSTLLQVFHRMQCGEKKNQKSVNIWRRRGQKFAAYLLGHPAYAKIKNIQWLGMLETDNLLSGYPFIG